MGTDTTATRRGIEWRLIAPGVVLLVMGIINTNKAAEGSYAAPPWMIAGFVALGGVLVLVGILRSVRQRN